MKRSTLITLAVIAALLAGYLLLGQGDRPARDGERRLLPGVTAARVERIAIAQHGAPRIELARSGATWALTAPVRGPADRATVAAILSAVEFLETWRALQDGVSAKQRGLDPPRIRLELFGRSGERLAELRLGAADPSGQRRYAQLAGQVHVVTGELHRLLDRAPHELRSPQLLPWPAAQVQRVELGGVAQPPGPPGGRLVVLQRQPGGGWSFVRSGSVAPHAEEAAGDRGRARPGLPQALDALRAALFAPDAVPGPARREATISGPREERVALRFGGECPGARELRIVYARELPAAERRPAEGSRWPAACVARGAVERVLGLLEDPADRRLTRVREARLAALTIARGGATLALRRRAGAWRIVAGSQAAAEADADLVRDLVQGLRVRGQLRSADPALLARLAASPERVTLERDDGARETLLFGAPRDGMTPVRRGAEPAVLWVASTTLPALTADALAFGSREVLALAAAEVERVVTTRHDGGREQRETLRREPGGWVVVEPVRGPADAEQVQRLLEALSGLRAVRLLPPRRGFTPTTVVEISTAAAQDLVGDARSPARGAVRLELGLVRGERCPGHVAGGAWFELSAALCRLLAARRTPERGAAR